jgi:O-antigen ligase
MKVSDITNKSGSLSALIVTLAVISFPITYLSVRHGVHVSLYLLFILSIFYWIFISKNKLEFFYDNESLLLFLSLASLLLATAITQLIRQDLNWRSFDGPSRIFLAGLVFIYLKNTQISFINILERVIPISLFVLLAVLILNPETSAQWGGRLASKFVDPNSLGSQVMILSMLCLLSIHSNDSIFGNTLKFTGAIIGLYISLYAGSRGGWVAFPFLATLIFYLKISNLSIRSNWQKPMIAVLALLTLTILYFLAYKNINALSVRIDIAINEIKAAFLNESYNTSVGTRIAMWKISLSTLVPMAGFSGFGEGSMGTVVSSLNLDPQKFAEPIFHLSNTGPHSDLLSKLLSMGYVGGVAYIATLVIPCLFFWKNKRNTQANIRIAAHIGLCFIAGVFVCGLSNEMLSLKYLCTFYGLLSACLMAEILRSPTIKTS